MQMMKVAELVPHPRNDEFFDDMSGEKWNEFLESVKTSGVIEPIVITQDKVIVSGHQRVRACKELGIDTIMAETRHYANDDAVLKDLIETNVRQRGSIGGSDIKLGNRIRELERIYGVRNGSAISTRGSNGTSGKSDMTQQELAERMGIDLNTLKRAKALTTLSPEIQDLVEQGNISASTASRLIAKLSPEEQEELISALPAADRLTQKQIQTYIDQIKSKDNQIAGYKLKVEQDKEKMDALRAECDAARKAEPQAKIVTKEVVPADYEEMKSELESLRHENKVLTSDNRKRQEEVAELKEKLGAVEEDSKLEGIESQLEKECIFFYTRCNSFLKAVGGYAYLADKLDALPESERVAYKKAVESIMAWAQNILSAM